MFRYRVLGSRTKEGVAVPDFWYRYPVPDFAQDREGCWFLSGGIGVISHLDILGTPTVFPPTLNRVLLLLSSTGYLRRKERKKARER